MSETFIPKNESFTCIGCGKEVAKAPQGYRNHCPFCFVSQHVDINPGDRANACQGKLKPADLTQDKKKGWIIIFECEKCGDEVRNKTAPDDDMDALIAFMLEHNEERLKQ